jgi:hypothetical protein
MQRDHITSRSTKKYVKWFVDKSVMQKGLANHTSTLDIDGKGICVEAIEELLLSASVTAADVDKCTAEWGEAEAFVTEQKQKSALAFYIQQARVEAPYRIALKRPGLQRQLSWPAQRQTPISVVHLRLALPLLRTPPSELRARRTSKTGATGALPANEHRLQHA